MLHVINIHLRNTKASSLPTLSPEGATLLLQGQTHAGVTVGPPSCTRRTVHQIEISRTRLRFPITVFWQITGAGGRTAKNTWAFQLDTEEEEEEWLGGTQRRRMSRFTKGRIRALVQIAEMFVLKLTISPGDASIRG